MKPLLLCFLFISFHSFAQISDYIPSIKKEISLAKRKNGKSKKLAIERIIGLKVDSIYYRGQVKHLTDSSIIFQTYYRNGKKFDSVYIFNLANLQTIKYFRANNLERYIRRHVRENKELSEVPMKILMSIGASALILHAINEFTLSNGVISDVLIDINVYSFLAGFIYAGCIIVPSYVQLKFYNVTTKWKIE